MWFKIEPVLIESMITSMVLTKNPVKLKSRINSLKIYLMFGLLILDIPFLRNRDNFANDKLLFLKIYEELI
ncbi:MAG: hypothetical protein AN484_01995 [Aphanizomenon flos-aquae WA102]|uniref:Uncharacterized protein n=1 Tax=Aphanizomenon flos-aquae WA102 TaxID=1710896 RepID=A0A1B7X7J3_APHFL|nr:MAG: hypothetical protein AN484_01995 [Aphanizomenon flos-aquae WA102]